jgi:hypothetical protein
MTTTAGYSLLWALLCRLSNGTPTKKKGQPGTLNLMFWGYEKHCDPSLLLYFFENFLAKKILAISVPKNFPPSIRRAGKAWGVGEFRAVLARFGAAGGFFAELF